MSDPAHEQVLDAAQDLLAKGLTEGTAGNLSARRADGKVVITPSSVDYRTMTLDDLCVIDLDGKPRVRLTDWCKPRSPASKRRSRR